MHRFATRSLLFKLRLSALLLVVFFLSCVLLPFAVVWGTLLHDERGLQACFVLLPSAFLSGLLFLMASSGVRCPLCRGQVLRRPPSANNKAISLLGSHRLHVIAGTLFKGHFRCSHCGEPCETQNPRRRPGRV